MKEDVMAKSVILPKKHATHTRNRAVAATEELQARKDALKHHGDLNPLLDTRDLAVFLGVAYITVTKWRRLGVGPPWINVSYTDSRKAAQIRYDYRDVVAWLEDRKFMPQGSVRHAKEPIDNSHMVFRNR